MSCRRPSRSGLTGLDNGVPGLAAEGTLHTGSASEDMLRPALAPVAAAATAVTLLSCASIWPRPALCSRKYIHAYKYARREHQFYAPWISSAGRRQCLRKSTVFAQCAHPKLVRPSVFPLDIWSYYWVGAPGRFYVAQLYALNN